MASRKEHCCVCDEEVDFQDLRRCVACDHAQGTPGAYRCFQRCTETDCETRLLCPTHPMTCWEAHLPTLPKLRPQHVPRDPVSDLFVQQVTYSAPNQKEQKVLHERDRIAQWFTIRPPGHGQGSNSRLCITDRFRQLCNPGITTNRYISHQSPGFVSFIGDTGVGKSTLLRAMMWMSSIDPSGDSYEVPARGTEDQQNAVSELLQLVLENEQGPVSRSADHEHLIHPTSLGVHLYRDPEPSYRGSLQKQHRESSNTPMLLVDCEGFRGGTTETSAEYSETTSSSVPGQLLSDLPIEAKGYTERGKDGTELFYARFLYTISDVLIFVIKEDTTLQVQIQRLFEWAEKAVHKAINHPSHKALIIVRNMPSKHHNTDVLYDSESLRWALLKDLKPLWNDSEILRKFVEKHNVNASKILGAIKTNEDLFNLFFQNISACYVPDTARAPADEVFAQYRRLRGQIFRASQRVQEIRSRSWMQYNVPALTHILNRAFEHFRTSDAPFDFKKAARNDNPNPQSMSDHLANFLRHAFRHHADTEKMIDHVVPNCLVAWTLRSYGLVAKPDDIFEDELKKQCKDGLLLYAEQYQQCSFKFEDGACCAWLRPQHQQHCDDKGNMQPGQFETRNDISSDVLAFWETQYASDYTALCEDAGTTLQPRGLPSRKQASAFREETLGQFQDIWKDLRSNKTCLACLQRTPDQMLECGHAYCPRCISDFGRPSEYYESGWIMDSCILCRKFPPDHDQTIHIEPRCAGVRVLTLDGGGVRGIVELSLLERLSEEIGLSDVPLTEFFDLIMGTSTGGIIALGLAMREDLTIGETKAKFLATAARAFKSPREGQLVRKLDPLQVTSKIFLLLGLWNSIYPTTPLREKLIDLFTPEMRLFGSTPQTRKSRVVRVAVTSAKEQGWLNCLITNYNRLGSTTDQEDDFEREDNPRSDFKVWEAALATSAAPVYFRPFNKLENKTDYIDGGLKNNCPAPYALREIHKIWPPKAGNSKVALDILLSVGTGIQKAKMNVPKVAGFEAICTAFLSQMDSEQLWTNFMAKETQPEVKNKMHRLNVLLSDKPEEYIALDKAEKMEALDELIRRKLSRSGPLLEELGNVASILIASLFFFEPDLPDTPSHSQRVWAKDRGVMLGLKGTIRCRLAHRKPPLKALVEKIHGFWQRKSGARGDWSAIPFTAEQKRAIRSDSTGTARLRIGVQIDTFDPDVVHELAVTLHLKGSTAVTREIPISGFPTTLRELWRRMEAV